MSSNERRLEIQIDFTSATVSALKRKLEDMEGIPVSRQLLRCPNGATLYDDEALLSSYGTLDGALLHLSVIPDDHFLVAVEQASEATVHFTVGRDNTVFMLKEMIEQEQGVAVGKQMIVHHTNELANTTVLSSLLPEDENWLVVVQLELRYQLTLHLHTGATIELQVAWNEPVETLEAAVNRRGRVPYHHQELMYDGRILEIGHRISEYGVTDGANLTVNLRDYETMVFIKTLTGRTIMVMVGPRDTVAEVKRKIEQQEGIPASRQRLIFVGEQLHDQHCLLDYRIEHESAVHLVLRSGESYELYVDIPGGRSHAFEVLPTDGLSLIHI